MPCNNPNCSCNKKTCACGNDSCPCAKTSTGGPVRPNKRIFTPKKLRIGKLQSMPRYLPSMAQYGDNIRYGMAKGYLSALILRQIGLDPMAYLAVPPHLVDTPDGNYLMGTITANAPAVAEPYSCKSEVIIALAQGLKKGILGYDLVAAIGLNPYAVRSCLP